MHVILRRKASKNLSLTRQHGIPLIRFGMTSGDRFERLCHSERLCLEEPKRVYCEISHIRSRWQTMSFWRPQGGRISIKVNMKEGIPRRAYALARNNMTVILNGTQWSEESPSNGIKRFLVFTRNDNHLGFLTLGLPASIRNNKREGFPIFTIRNTMK